MTFLFTVLHISACLALIMIVLLQTGKGADMGASLGGGGNQTLFGTSGATTVLSKITTGIAILFMLTSLFLAYKSGSTSNKSIMKSNKPAVEQTIPADTTDTTVPAPESSTKPSTPAPADTAPEAGATE